ncbi:MAG: adenosylcobinamide-GDP ribazoletransferase [Acidimicrobiia bacterium]
MSPVRQALAFLTVLGRASVPGPRALRGFPAAGALVGAAVGVAWWGAGEAFSPLVAAVVAVGFDLALTGMLHFDGLADSADGLLPPVERARRLAIMSAPDTGAFGTAVVGLALLARVAGFAALEPDPLLVAGLWCAARTAMVAAVAWIPYVRGPGGLAAAFTGGPSLLVPVVAGTVAAAALVVVGGGGAGLVGLVAGAVAGAGVLRLAVVRIGGITGDVLGATGVVVETVALVVAGARW